MTLQELQHKETRLIETLLSALDARETARDAESSMLVYLTDVLVTRVREELVDVRAEAERVSVYDRGDKAARVPPGSDDGSPHV